jgi:DNA-binding MarR family transcriptional regulator
MTLATRLVLHALLTAPGDEMYGREIGMHAGLPSGIVAPILARLEQAGWVASRREEATAKKLGRPVRRYWQLTDTGEAAACGTTAPGTGTAGREEKGGSGSDDGRL